MRPLYQNIQKCKCLKIQKKKKENEEEEENERKRLVMQLQVRPCVQALLSGEKALRTKYINIQYQLPICVIQLDDCQTLAQKLQICWLLNKWPSGTHITIQHFFRNVHFLKNEQWHLTFKADIDGRFPTVSKFPVMQHLKSLCNLMKEVESKLPYL